MVVTLAACGEEISRQVRVEPVPAPARVAFVFTDVSLFYGLNVTTCKGSRVMWLLSDEQLTAPPARIEYGVAPPGFASRAGPEPLVPGCYVVTASGPSSARFELGADGRVTVDSSRVRKPPAPVR
jgi:hypothetical protein